MGYKPFKLSPTYDNETLRNLDKIEMRIAYLKDYHQNYHKYNKRRVVKQKLNNVWITAKTLAEGKNSTKSIVSYQKYKQALEEILAVEQPLDPFSKRPYNSRKAYTLSLGENHSQKYTINEFIFIKIFKAAQPKIRKLHRFYKSKDVKVFGKTTES